MSFVRSALGAAFIFFCALSLSPAPIAAQCSQNCGGCGWSEYEGYNDGTKWETPCTPGTGSCSFCLAPARVGDNTPEESIILDEINTAAVSDLAAVVEKYRDHLLLNPDRNLLAFRGLGCDPEAVGSVAFLSSEKTRALQELGTASLTEFVESQRLDEH